MKYIYQLFTISILSIISSANLNAQQIYPVNATGVLIPPFSMVLSDYTSSRSQDMMFTVTLNDPIEPSRQVYFRLTVKHNFQTIYQTDPNFATQPMTLQQFQPTVITGSDLALYLNPNALQAVNGSQASGLLPEGYNQICLEVMDFERRVPISKVACAGGFFKTLEAPLLDLPTCGAAANISTTQNLMFRWQPRHLGQPNAPSAVQYIFKMVELQPGFTNPFDVFDLSPQVYQTTLSTSTFFYTDTEPQLEEGKTYAWRVQATDGSGSSVFQNDGKSPVCTFTVTKNKTNTANNTPNNIIPSCGANLTAYGPITYSNPKSGLIAVGDAIKLGYFDMKITQLNSTGDSYSGDGTVHIPFLKAHVPVEFLDLKISPAKQVYEVTSVKAKRDVNMGLNPNDLTASGLAIKINQSNLLNQLNAMVNLPTAGGRKVSQRNDADLTPIGLPLIMDRNGLPSVVLVDVQFTTTHAKLVAIGIEKDAQNKPLPLTGADIPFTPHGIGQNKGLSLTNDYAHTLPNGSSIQILANQTYAKLDCNGFAGYDLKGKYLFSRNVALPISTNPTAQATANFTGTGNSLTDFIVDVAKVDDFTIPTIKDYVFSLENGKLDLSNTSNPSTLNFPTVYTNTKNDDWQGFSFEKIKVNMPNQWTFGNQTATSNLELTQGQIVINNDGVYANLFQDNLVTLASGKVRDWNVSINKMELEIVKSKVGLSDVEGQLKLPVLDDPFDYYKGNLTSNQNGDVNIGIKPSRMNAKMSMWFAEMNFDTLAVAQIMTRNINNKKSFIPYGSLSGEINIQIDSATFAKSIIGNSTLKLIRLKQALDYTGEASLSVSNVFLKGFVIDPTNIASKRYLLKDYEKSPVDLDVIIGNKHFAPNSIQVFYEPQTQNEPNRLGLEIAVQNGSNVVSIIIWAKQDANNQFVFSHLDTDSRLVDCDCTSLDDREKYRGYGSHSKWNEEVLLASNDVNVDDFYKTAADKFTLNGDEITVPYLKNMKIKVQQRGNKYIAQSTTFNNQNPVNIKKDLNAPTSVAALDLSAFKVDDSYLQGLAGQMSRTTRSKLPIDLSLMFKEFLGKYDATKYPFPANSHLILTGIEFDNNLESASGQVILAVKQGGKWVTFANGDVLLEPKAVGFKVLQLYLTDEIQGTDPKIPVTFKKGLKNTPSEGSYASIQCEGFKEFNIQSVYSTNKLHPASVDAANAIVFDSMATAEIPFIIKGNDLIDFISEIDYAKVKPFVIGKDGGKMFTITKGFLDHHSQKNPVNTPPAKGDLKGLFIGEADMMVWGFMKKDGSRKPLVVKANNIVYSHAEGITAKINLNNPVPVASKSDMDGWNYVIENLNFEIEKNAFKKQDVKGKIELLIVKDGEFMAFNGQVGWDAVKKIPTAVFNVDKAGKKDFSMPFLPAVLLMIESGTEVGFSFAKGKTRSEFSPNAKITGKMGIKITPLDDVYQKLPAPVKKALPLEFVLGGIVFQDLKLNHPDDMNAAAGCIDNQGVVGGIKTFSVASFGIDTTSVLGDLMNSSPRYNKFKDKAAGMLEGFPISIENVTFRCDKHKSGAGNAATYTDMFKLQFDIIVNLMPGEQETAVDSSGSDATANKVDDGDDPIESIAGLFDEGGGQQQAPASSKPKSTAGIAAAGQFGLWFKPEKDGNGGQDLVFDHISLDALKVDAKFSILTLSGTLMCYNDDPTYGDGFKGHIRVDISKGSGGAGTGQAKGFQVTALAQFGTAIFDYGNGNIQKEKYKNDPYRYFFVDLEVVSKKGVGAKIALHGLGGGFFFNMARENSKVLEAEKEKQLGKLVASGKKPKIPQKLPDEIDYSKPVLDGVDPLFYTPGASLSGYKYYPQKGAYGGYLKGIFSVAKRPDLAAFDIAIGLELVKNSSGNLGLSKIFARGDLYVQGDADITLRKEAPGKGHIDITYDHINKALTCDFAFDFQYKTHIIPNDPNSPVYQEMKVTGTGGMLFSFGSNKKWYVKIGRPQLQDRIAMEMSTGGISLNTTRAYLQFGHDLDALPKLSELIPGWPTSLDAKQSKSQADLSGGDGLMFGVNFQLAKIEKNFLMFKARLEAGGGFDLKVAKYVGIKCANTPKGTLGVNNWYAKGQAYMYLKAGVDLDVDLWFYSGSVNIFDAMAAVALQAQLPNPTWMRGAFYGQYSVLGGAVEGDVNFQFELGEKCAIQPGTDFLNKIALITDILPDSASTKVPIFTELGAGFAVPMNRQFLVESMDANGKEVVRRFIPFVKKAELKSASGSIVSGRLRLAPSGYELSFTPNNMLEANTDYVFTIEMKWKEYENNGWKELPQGETRLSKFKTGDLPNKIYNGMIATMTPGDGQRYWHRNYGKARLIFKSSFGYLFPSNSGEFKNNSTLTSGIDANTLAKMPNNIPLEYYVELIEYNTSGKANRTIEVPINSNHDKSFKYWREGTTTHDNMKIGIPYIYEHTDNGRELLFDQINQLDLCQGCMVEFSIKRRPAKSHMAIKAAQNLQKADTKNNITSKNAKVNKRVTTLSAVDVSAVSELYGTYYTTYFGVSQYDNLHEKLRASYGRGAAERSKKLPKYYEFPTNINLPNTSWLKGIDKTGPTYYKYSTGREPLDEYDIARLRANLKREDKSADWHSKTVNWKGYPDGGFYNRKWNIRRNNQWVDKTLAWDKLYSSSTVDGSIQDWVNRNSKFSGKNKVEVQNFYRNVMRPYYEITNWSHRIAINNGLKLKITSAEQGTKKLNNSFVGSFTGLDGTTSSHSYAIVIMDDYIMKVQAMAARKAAEDIAVSSWAWKIYSNNDDVLPYFLTASTLKKDKIRVDDYYYDKYWNNNPGYDNTFLAHFSYLNKWSYSLEKVNVNNRSGFVSFSGGGLTHFNQGTSARPNLKVHFASSDGNVKFEYDKNTTLINEVKVTATRGYYHWDRKNAESNQINYNKDGKAISVTTKLNQTDLPNSWLHYYYPKSTSHVSVKVLLDSKSSYGIDNAVHRGNTKEFNSFSARPTINIDPIVKLDYDFNKSRLLLSGAAPEKIMIYEVNAEGESKRIAFFNGSRWWDDYTTGKSYSKDSGLPSLIPGKTYHIYHGQSYYHSSGTIGVWYVIDNSFWTTNKGKLRIANTLMPFNPYSKCKINNVNIESGPQFAFRFTPKGTKKAGETASSWQSADSDKIKKWLDTKDDFTAEARIKPEKGNATIMKLPNSGGEWKIENGKVVVTLSGIGTITSTKTLTEGKWHHLAFTYKKASKEITIYINTEQDKVQRFSSEWSPSVYSSNNFITGNGAIVLDDISIWKTARTRQELIASATSKQPVLGSDLVLNYDFSNGISSRELLDLSQNRIKGNIKGGDCYCDYQKSNYANESPVTASVAYNYVLDFDGDEYVNVPNTSIQNNGAFTAEGWIKVKANTKDATFVRLGDATLQIKKVGAFTDKFKLGFIGQLQDNSTKNVLSTDFVQVDKWHYIALIQEAPVNGKTNIRILIDGAQSGQLKAVSPVKMNGNLKLGGDGTANANIVMDEWRIWSIARKISSVAYMIRNGIQSGTDMTKQVAYYDFDKGGPGKSELTDVTVNAKHGALTQMEANEDWVLSDRTPVPSTTGNYALRFDGKNDYIEVPHSNTLNIGNNCSIEFWAKSKTAVTSHIALLRKEQSYAVDIKPNNELMLSSWGEEANFGQNTYIIDDSWHHYVMTIETGQGAKLYIDGVLIKSVSGSFTPNQGSNALYIGGFKGRTNNPSLAIENLMIWNRTLPLAEIEKNAVTPTTETNKLILHYNFDAGRGKTALGRSPNRINGVLSTDMKDDDWQSLNSIILGNRAIDFDGKDDYLKGEKVSFDNVEGFNLEAWINIDKLHEVRPYTAHIAGMVDTSGTVAIRLAKVQNQWRIQGVLTFIDGSRIILNAPTPVQTKKWYKIRLDGNKNKVFLHLNGKVVKEEKRTQNLKGQGIFTIGGHAFKSHFDGVVDNALFTTKGQGDVFRLDLFENPTQTGEKGGKLTYQNMDVNTTSVPSNLFYGLPALAYPNAETILSATTDKLVYNAAWDKAYQGYLGFSIDNNETIEAVSIYNASNKSELLFWEKDKAFIRYNYKTVNGKKVLDGISKMQKMTALYRGDYLPLQLPNGNYIVEVKIGGTWYKATIEIGASPKEMKLVKK